MQEKLKSDGKCLFCGKTFAKAGINRHLATHLKEKAEPGKSFLVKVETDKRWGSSPYFLSLWVDGEATLKAMYKFLRDIWLECCGHLSAFRNPKRRSTFGWDFAINAPKNISKNAKILPIILQCRWLIIHAWVYARMKEESLIQSEMVRLFIKNKIP